MRLLNPIVIFSSVFFIMAMGCISKSNTDTTQPGPRDGEQKIVGGFTKIPADSPVAQKAFNFLKQEIAKKEPAIMVGVVKTAESQVVAGNKIRLTCEYADDREKGRVRLLMATVYVDLNETMTLLELVLDIAGK
jgi:hypothetical protein